MPDRHDDELFLHLGERDVFGGTTPLGLYASDLMTHLWAIGKSGTGKTTLLKNLAVQLIEADAGILLLDPHGDISGELLDLIPPRRIDDVCWFDPSDLAHPIAFNVLAPVPPDRRHLVVDGLIAAFHSIWGDSWGPRLQHILRNCFAALLECQNVSLLGVPRLLVDDRYRRWVVGQVKDVVTHTFWTGEWESYDRRYRAEIAGPVMNKVMAVLASPPLRLTLGQVRRSLDPRFAMDTGRIVLANLSKGKLGAENASLMGALLVNAFFHDAMARADVPPAERRPFYILIDEVQSFASTDTFAQMLSEIRKMNIGVVAAHQYLDQLSPALLSALRGNCGSTVCFRVGEKDAQNLSREFGDMYSASAFSGLNNHQVLARLMNVGRTGEPLIARTHPPLGKRYGRRSTILDRSRERFSTPRGLVERRIETWMQSPLKRPRP